MRVACVAMAALAACTPESSVVRDSADRVEIELVGAVGAREQDGDKVLYRSGAITVTFQRAERRAPGGPPTLDEVADALVQRYTSGEVEGSLAARECRAGADEARCVDGHIVRDGTRIERRGFLVEDGESVVLVEVLGERAYAERIDEQLERALVSFRWVAS